MLRTFTLVFSNLSHCKQLHSTVFLKNNEKINVKKSLRTCFTCMSPGVGLQVVRPGEFSLTSFTLEWFHT